MKINGEYNQVKQQFARTQNPLDGQKDIIKFFRNYTVEVKQVSKGQQLSIYDFNTNITLYWTNTHTAI